MKRLHISLAVADIDQSTAFYSTLFGVEPTVSKPDYVKWMLDDPRVNFVVQSRGAKKGIDHMGIQVESDTELAEVERRLVDAARPVHAQKATTCCYAKSNKAWTADPEGIAWETSHTFDSADTYGTDTDGLTALRQAAASPASVAKACCAA